MPIPYQIKDKENNSLEVIQPVGGRIYCEPTTYTSRRKVREVRNYNNLPTLGERASMGKKQVFSAIPF